MLNSPNQSHSGITECDSGGCTSGESARACPGLPAAPPRESMYFQKRDAKNRKSVLIEIIEGEIIPRLFLTHCALSHGHQNAVTPEIVADDGNCESVANLFIGGNSAAIVGHVETLIARGVRREQIFLDFLAPVPRTLSILWSEGRCSFDAMVSGLACVDQVLQEIHDKEARGSNN